jgi:alcohol dehydrogenase class IV
VVPDGRSGDTALKNRAFRIMIQDLCRKIGVPEDLAVFGVNPENAGPLLADIDNLAAAFAQNPVEFSVEDGKAMVQRLIGSQHPRVKGGRDAGL